jgi:hypothetical protein
MLLALINFVHGLLIAAVPSILVIWRRGELHRGLRALALVPFPFALGFAMFMDLRWGPAKSIANIGEFVMYGVAAGTIPLGQFIRLPFKKVPGELLPTIAACLVVASIYMLTPSLPETKFG